MRRTRHSRLIWPTGSTRRSAGPSSESWDRSSSSLAGRQTKEVESRPAYFAELAAYLAAHPAGRTPNEVAADFGIQNNTLHTRLGQLRKWLGKQPDC